MRKRYAGPKLALQYTDADDLTVLHDIPMSPGYCVRVVGNPDWGAYEWLVERAGKIAHSDVGYGDPDIALRDGLIVMHGLPHTNPGGELATDLATGKGDSKVVSWTITIALATCGIDC